MLWQPPLAHKLTFSKKHLTNFFLWFLSLTNIHPLQFTMSAISFWANTQSGEHTWIVKIQKQSQVTGELGEVPEMLNYSKSLTLGYWRQNGWPWNKEVTKVELAASGHEHCHRGSWSDPCHPWPSCCRPCKGGLDGWAISGWNCVTRSPLLY